VHAIEANPNSFSFAQRSVLPALPATERSRVRLHSGISTSLSRGALSPSPQCIVHELISPVASTEGMVGALQNFRLKYKHGVSACIPFIVRTLCAPVELRARTPLQSVAEVALRLEHIPLLLSKSAACSCSAAAWTPFICSRTSV
jgi:hypothetical protein